MLMQIRERATGIFAYIIVTLIIIPFAFWGIQEYFTGGNQVNVAEVEGYEISVQEFDARLKDQRRYLRDLLGDQAEDFFGEEDADLKDLVLNQIIQDRLLTQEIDEQGYRVTDNRIYQRLQSIPQFQVNGQFDNETYQRMLTTQRRNAVEFESQIRREEAINQYRGSVVYSAFLPSEEKYNYAALQQQKRSYEYFRVTVSEDQIEVSEQAIQDYYQANQSQFSSAAKVKLEYLAIQQQSLAEGFEISEQDLKDEYDNEPQRYRTQELRHASHILFKLNEQATDLQIEQAFEKAQQAVQRLDDGEDFGLIASTLSEDNFADKNNGALGLLSRTDIDNPEFINKLFSMDSGETSDPIRTKLGVQIIKLGEIVKPVQRTFDEVKAQINSEMRSQLAQTEFVRRAEMLQELSYEFPDNLDKAAEALELNVQSTDWIQSDSGDGIAQNAKVRASAFSEDALMNRYNSDLIEIDEGYVAVIRVVEHEPEQVQDLHEVSAHIKAILASRLAIQQAETMGYSLLEKLKAGEISMQQAADGADIIQETSVQRNSQSPDQQILKFVFTVKAAASEQPVYAGTMVDSEYVLIQLNSVEKPEADATLNASQWITLQGQYGRREMNSMLKALRETKQVKLFTENL